MDHASSRDLKGKCCDTKQSLVALASHERHCRLKLPSVATGWFWSIAPYVCQHIGVESVVRPQLHFAKADIGRCRVGYASLPPYMLADDVRNFRGQHAAA